MNIKMIAATTAMIAVASVASAQNFQSGDMPVAAQPGQCFAKVSLPAKYEMRSRRVVVDEGGERIETIPAKYEMVTERLLAKEASTQIKVIPATYRSVTERVMVKPEEQKVLAVPAQYKNVTERILVEPARTVWKQGAGHAANSNVQTKTTAGGDIMCLVEIPAKYKTVTKRVMVKPATTRSEVIPAEYRTVTKQVVATPARTQEMPVAAEYKTVQVRKMVQPAQTRKIAIEPKYNTVKERVQVNEPKIAWQPIVCQDNATSELIAQVQNQLKAAGYNPGSADGVLGEGTIEAARKFQRANNLYEGQLTIETIEKLGIRL